MTINLTFAIALTKLTNIFYKLVECVVIIEKGVRENRMTLTEASNTFNELHKKIMVAIVKVEEWEKETRDSGLPNHWDYTKWLMLYRSVAYEMSCDVYKASVDCLALEHTDPETTIGLPSNLVDETLQNMKACYGRLHKICLCTVEAMELMDEAAVTK